MSSSVTGIKGQTGDQAPSTMNKFNDMDLQSFITMLVAEMQQQDPMNPMDSSEILGQISQIQQISTSQQLNDTLQSVLLGQNLASANNMLNRTIDGLTDDGRHVSGVVDKVTIDNDVVNLHIGSDTVRLSNVGTVLPEDTSQDDIALLNALYALLQSGNS